MTDLISRADAIEAVCDVVIDEFGVSPTLGYEVAEKALSALPSADALLKQEIDFHKEVSRIEAEKVVDLEHKLADAVTIHEDGTLEVKVPNAYKVGRVLVVDTDSHIGGGLFYPDDAEANWIPCSERLPSEDGQYLVFYEGIIIGSWIEIMWYGEPLMPNVDVPGKHFYRSDSEWGDIIYDEVIAWMPLPEAYKGGDSE